MGEYATTRTGQRIKMGTCEDLTSIRYDHIDQLTPEGAGAYPWDDGFRFRFPFPDEDNVGPGEYADYDRSLNVPGVNLPDLFPNIGDADTLKHHKLQFISGAALGGGSTAGGYNVCLPCPADPQQIDGVSIRRNGGQAGASITAVRPVDGQMRVIVRCAPCGARYNLDADGALALTAHLETLAAEEESPYNRFGSPQRANFWREIALRILRGYVSPPAAVAATKEAEVAA